ncbi:MAG: hypothetical protein ACRDF4_06530 [Rhabdochlamydiaceae bacterium]
MARRNPLESSTLIFPSEYKHENASKGVLEHYALMGYADSDQVRACVEGELGYRVAGDWSSCHCPPQILRLSCHLPWCWRCADKERKRLASDMVKYIHKVYSTSELPLRASHFEFTLPSELWELVSDTERLNYLREIAVKTVYEWFGLDPKQYMLFVDANVDVWGSAHVTRGIQPHCHVTVYSICYDKRAKRFVESPRIGWRCPPSELDNLRALWRKNVCGGLCLKSRAPNFDLKYHWTNESVYGETIAYAKLSRRLSYMYRSPVVDVVKFLSQAVTSEQHPIDFNYAWLGRLLNFYSGKSRGDKRLKHVQRFGCLADRVQKKYGNLLAVQHSKQPNFKSPSERSSDSKKPRCLYHRMSVGEWLTSRIGLSIDECLREYPLARIVGKVKERRIGEFRVGG